MEDEKKKSEETIEQCLNKPISHSHGWGRVIKDYLVVIFGSCLYLHYWIKDDIK